MHALYFWLLFPYVCQAQCPWPFVETTHDYVLKEFNITGFIPASCGMGCGIDPTPAVQFRIDDQEWIDMLCSVLSLIGLLFVFWFGFNLWLQHKERSSNLCREDLSYQIPFLINLGYLIFFCTLLFHKGSILIDSDSPSYCNLDEQTMSVGDPANGNPYCTIQSLVVFIIIKLEISYTTLLSIVLFRMIWFPLHRIRNCKIISHSVIWLIIAITTSCVIFLNSMEAVSSMRTCMPTLQNPTATLWLEIIPFVLYQSVGTVLLFLCLYKLWRMWVETDDNDIPRLHPGEGMSKEYTMSSTKRMFSLSTSRSKLTSALSSKISFQVKDCPRAKKLRELSIRLLIFNLVHSTFVGMLCFNLYYWFEKHGQWTTAGEEVLTCQVMAYGMYMLYGVDDSNGALLEAAYDCIDDFGQDGPPAWALWLFYVICLGGTISGCVLTCSNQTVQKYKGALDTIKEKLGLPTSKDADSSTSRLQASQFETTVTMTSEMMTIQRSTQHSKQVKGDVTFSTRTALAGVPGGSRAVNGRKP